MGGRAHAALVGLLVASLLLAGCTGGKSPPPAPGPQADFTDLDLKATSTTGILRGVVVDEAVRPLAGAVVSTTLAEGKARNTTTAADGAFGFDGLEPGTYFLRVSKFGYRDTQVSADVVAGVREPPLVKVLLAVDPTQLPYFTAEQWDAFVACSFTFSIVSFAACGLAADQTNNDFLHNFFAERPPGHIQIEAIWESTQVLGGELGLSVTALGPPQVTANASSGPSPIYITINASQALQFNYTSTADSAAITVRLFSTDLTGTDVIPEEQVHSAWKEAGYPAYNGTGVNPTVQGAFDSYGGGLLLNPFNDPNCVKYIFLFNSCLSAGGVGMALQQRVTVFTHIFYGYAPPTGWRFSDGGDVPQPPG